MFYGHPPSWWYVRKASCFANTTNTIPNERSIQNRPIIGNNNDINLFTLLFPTVMNSLSDLNMVGTLTIYNLRFNTLFTFFIYKIQPHKSPIANAITAWQIVNCNLKSNCKLQEEYQQTNNYCQQSHTFSLSARRSSNNHIHTNNAWSFRLTGNSFHCRTTAWCTQYPNLHR